MSFQSHILPLLSHFLARRSCANWTWQPRRHVQQTRIVTRLSCLAHNNIKPTLVPSLCQAGAPKGRAQAALKVHLGGAMSSASHWQQWLEYLPRKICEDVPLQRPGWCSVRQRGEHRVKCQRDLQHSNVRTHTHTCIHICAHTHTYSRDTLDPVWKYAYFPESNWNVIGHNVCCYLHKENIILKATWKHPLTLAAH